MKSNNKLDDIISEAMDAGGTIFGGAAYGGAGTFSYAQQAGAKTWAPRTQAQRTGITDPQGYNVKDIGDEEHMFAHKAPQKRPFPLETINDYIAQAYLELCNAESQFNTCIQYNTVISNHKEKKVLLKHLHRKTKAIKIMLKNMAKDLDRISFS